MQEHDSIDYWPQEVLLAFFKNLEPAQIGHFAEVCKKWFQMSKDNEFWRQKCAEQWSLLPKEKDCKRNWLIPTKEGDTLIDWRRVYAIKKHWPDVIKCLEQYYDLSNQKAQKTAVKKLLDRVVHKDWISLADYKQLATNAIKYISERPLYMDQGGNDTLLDIECVDSAIQFFLKMDLVMLSRSNATRVKQIGTGLKFINIIQRRNPNVEKIRASLTWSFIQYTREYVQQLESKGLGYAAGLEVISEVSFLFEICMIQERREGLELIPKVIEILVNAINTWNIETYLVLRQSKSTQKMHFIMQALSLPIRVQKLSVVEVFVNAFKSISPPKTARESLTLAYFKNLLQTFLLNQEETKKLSEWYDSLPTPTGSAKDKTLMLYHYENLTNLETVKPTEEPKKNAACSFLLEAFLDLDERWQAKVMSKFLQHSKTYCWLLTNDQESVLFDMLKEISKQSSEAKNRAEKWIVQLAINCERISEYRELVISTIMDPANSNLLGASVYSHTDLLQAAMEEYEKEPRDYIETMLLKFGEEINMIPEGKLPPNVFSLLITVIGKQIALRRAQNNPNEDIQENGDIQWMDDDDDDEDEDDISDADRDEDEHEDEDENSQDDDMDEDDENMDEKGISPEIMEDSFDDSDEQQDPPFEYGTRELVDLLIRIASRMEDGETIKQNLPNMLDIIKTEYNNLKTLKFFIAIVGFFLSDRTEGNLASVADPIAASVVDWIHHTNLNDSNNTLDLFSKMLKTLVRTCSKNFLAADVVDVLLAWVDNGLNTATEEMMSLWGVLANHAVDPTHPANLLYQRLETMLKSDDDAEKHQAIVYMTHLLHADLFQNPKFVSLLKMVWKLSYSDLLEGTTAVIVRAVADFIGEMAQHRPLLVLENLQDILDVLEKTYKLKNLKSLSVSYALVINLIEDPATWIHHMKIFLETYKIYGSNSSYVDVISHMFPILYKLLSPDHPHHKLLLEDPALRTRIEEILKEFKSSNIDQVLELCQYYGV